ncbi:hypothetical protein GIB67_019199 [Kingdonia uniflora]|uniref:Peroxisomal membrane protein PEX16 n=1 Tax=Kingdonia uniflora TaxID=39325 RepID=A0A7J7N080_9MAGN|nr:hypothetical protein GIB67_019199 [Kingdonia uniflora]
METYKRWVRRNKEYVHSLESLANGLTWLLPERFAASEIGPEAGIGTKLGFCLLGVLVKVRIERDIEEFHGLYAVTAVLGIVTAVNEHIIETTPAPKQNRFKEPSVFPWSLCISTLKDLETLVEVVAEHLYGVDKKWDFIAVSEAIKVLVRLASFQDGGYKMLLHGGETPNVESNSHDSDAQQRMESFSKPDLRDRYGRDPRNLEGRALSALSQFGENAKMVSNQTWFNRTPHRQVSTIESPAFGVQRPTLSSILSEKGLQGGLFLTAEVMHIMRPLIYVMFIRKYGVRSWIPWLLSLAVDATGVTILSHVIHQGSSRKEGNFRLSRLETNEVRRRKLLWALYIMRDPFFTKYTRQRLDKTEKFVEPIPVIGFLTAKLFELIIGAQSRYTYMSGS